MLTASRRFIAEEHGAELVEYALLAAIVALGAVGALSMFSDSLNGLFQPLIDTLAGFLT